MFGHGSTCSGLKHLTCGMLTECHELFTMQCQDQLIQNWVSLQSLCRVPYPGMKVYDSVSASSIHEHIHLSCKLWMNWDMLL